MDQLDIAQRFGSLSTANVADACLRADVEVRCVAGIRPVTGGSRMAGRVLPARHAGSVDIFLEAIEHASPGDVLVVDNGGRHDEACVGDLIVLEAQAAGLAGMVIWGLHRDTPDIVAIGLPLFSLGALPTGPQRLDQRSPDALASASLGRWVVTADDLIFGDDDGVIAVPADRAEQVMAIAGMIRTTEQGQASRIAAGASLRAQLRFDDYLRRREMNPGLSFRDHLRTVGGAIEE
jgi:regulator of RNase E activity RraA